MAKLTIRGHELLDQTPVEVPVRMQKPLSVLDHQRIAMARARMEEEMQIKTDEDLMHDLFDFTPPEDVDRLPFFTTYTLTDEVPDVPYAEKSGQDMGADAQAGLEVSEKTEQKQVVSESS